MTCGNCVARVKSELLKLGNVISAEVQLQHPQAKIEMDQHIPTPRLQEALRKVGNYSISPDVQASQHDQPVSNITGEKSSYYPIVLIFSYITLITVLIQVLKGSFSWLSWMSHFMAGFFFIFSFFKILNLKGFSEGYGTYDILAKRIPVWGYAYPFVELIFAVLLVSGFEPVFTNIVIFLVMSVSSIGVTQSIIRKAQVQCACLGTVIRLPLSKVTLFEDLLMMAMSIGMVIAML